MTFTGKLAASTLLAAVALTACESNSVHTSPPTMLDVMEAGVAPRVIPDSNIDTIIDPGLPPSERAIMHQALLAIPPSRRAQGAILRTIDGRFHATSSGLLSFELEQQRLHKGRLVNIPASNGRTAKVEPASGSAQCPMRDLGGYNTGPFRRVYIGCSGYTQQDLSFVSSQCGISDYLMTGTDLHGGFLGAYTLDGHGGIDAGIVYSRKGSNDPGKWQDEILRNGVIVYGPTFECGHGQYSSTLLIAKSGAEVNQWELQTNTSPVILFDVPSTTFFLDGSNFIFRRLTGIGQSGNNFNSGEWFGFPGNDHNGPNLSKPDIAYEDTYAALGGGTMTQFIGQPNPNSYADRNPKVFNNMTGTICGQDPYWVYPDNFADYEGINLNNPNATGTFPAPNCSGN